MLECFVLSLYAIFIMFRMSSCDHAGMHVILFQLFVALDHSIPFDHCIKGVLYSVLLCAVSLELAHPTGFPEKRP